MVGMTTNDMTAPTVEVTRDRFARQNQKVMRHV
jgi:hypothetical protein